MSTSRYESTCGGFEGQNVRRWMLRSTLISDAVGARPPGPHLTCRCDVELLTRTVRQGSCYPAGSVTWGQAGKPRPSIPTSSPRPDDQGRGGDLQYEVTVNFCVYTRFFSASFGVFARRFAP